MSSHAAAQPKLPTPPALLTLVSREFQGQPMWAVDHPEHGELLMAKHVLEALGYAVKGADKPGGSAATKILSDLGIYRGELVSLTRHDVDRGGSPTYAAFPRGIGAAFMPRMSVRRLLVSSTKPKAKEFREWLADVSIKVEDTGGYLLNEAARDTAFADTRTTVPLPAAIAGGYEALIEARRAELKAREGRPSIAPPPRIPDATASREEPSQHHAPAGTTSKTARPQEITPPYDAGITPPPRRVVKEPRQTPNEHPSHHLPFTPNERSLKDT